MTPPSDSGTDAQLKTLRSDVERALDELTLPDEPRSLYAPVRYVLSGGGKRIRPIMLLLTAEMFGASRQEALPAAIAVEVFHNFTLVHDDIMDNADTRRGRDSVHARWDAPTAILSGDFMMALGYRALMQASGDPVDKFHIFDRMVERLCEGQALDKEYETRPSISLAQYLSMIDRKTAALIQAALELGGLCGRASVEDREQLRSAGLQIGRAFQIQDDLLDVMASDDRWGKSVGGDLREGKKTFLLVRALELSSGRDKDFLTQIAEDGAAEPEVDRARDIFDRVGVLTEARETIDRYTDGALTAIAGLSIDSVSRQTLLHVVQSLRVRPH